MTKVLGSRQQLEAFVREPCCLYCGHTARGLPLDSQTRTACPVCGRDVGRADLIRQATEGPPTTLIVESQYIVMVFSAGLFLLTVAFGVALLQVIDDPSLTPNRGLAVVVLVVAALFATTLGVWLGLKPLSVFGASSFRRWIFTLAASAVLLPALLLAFLYALFISAAWWMGPFADPTFLGAFTDWKVSNWRPHAAAGLSLAVVVIALILRQKLLLPSCRRRFRQLFEDAWAIQDAAVVASAESEDRT